MNNEEAIKEINQHIKDSLAEWSDIIQKAVEDEWFHLMDWDEVTVNNVTHIFNAIMVDSAMKRGIVDEDNVKEKWIKFNALLADIFGVHSEETNTDLN